MNLIEKRKQALLYTLSNQRDFVTADELSQVLDTSKKTVYRLIKQLNEEQDNGITIHSEKGRGFKLAAIERQQVTSSSRLGYSPIERRHKIMEELLFSAPKAMRVTKILEQFYISGNVLVADEKVMTCHLQEYKLLLLRKNRTLRVIGEEADIRRAINDLIQTQSMITYDQLELQSDSSFNKYDAAFVLKQVQRIEKSLKSTLPYPYNVNIFSHLYILISRFRKGVLPVENKSKLLTEEKAELDRRKDLTMVSEKIIQGMEQYLHTQLPLQEIYFLFQYLISSRWQDDQKESFSPEVEEITQFYMDEVVEIAAIPIMKEQIFNKLARHIRPLLNRLTHGIHVKNNLLEQIKLEYSLLYRAVEEVSLKVSQRYRLPVINEDESGFLTLYFAQAMEEKPHAIRALIVCTTGIGTSELLRIKIKKFFPEVEIAAVSSSRDLQEKLEQSVGVDLIISTIKLDQSINPPSVTVSAMLTVDDQKRLRQIIEEMNGYAAI